MTLPWTRGAALLLALALTLPVAACASNKTANLSEALVDHTEWDRLLRTYVDAEGLVAYRDLQDKDSTALDAYLAQLAQAQPQAWPRPEQLAFWINAYNAGIVSAILQGQSAEPLIGRGKLFKFWKFEVAGKMRSLNEVEHKILRADFEEPRIHFAIVCASSSCPKLRAQAYVVEKLETQLDEQARSFINDTARNDIGDATQTLRLSKIFDWFRDDFERDGHLLQFLARYVDDEAVSQRLQSGTESLDIKHLKYDWTLNAQADQRPRKPSRAAFGKPD